MVFFGFFSIVFDSIWPDFSERMRFFGRLKMFSSLVWLILWHKNPCRSGGARGVMVIIVGNGHGDTSSNSTNTLGKGMNPIILPPAMGK